MKLECEVVVLNPLGLHARPAAYIVEMLKNKRAQVWFSYRGETVSARSIMGVLILAAQKDARIKITVEGDDASDTLQALVEAFECQFEENLGHSPR